jgi:hypothetical protein
MSCEVGCVYACGVVSGELHRLLRLLRKHQQAAASTRWRECTCVCSTASQGSKSLQQWNISEVVAKQYIITEHLCWNSHTAACKSRHSRTTSCGGDLTVICRETDDNGGSTNEEDEW